MTALSSTLDLQKQQALERSGFRWLYRYGVWVDPDHRQVISNEWAHDHPIADLHEEISDRPAGNDWSFRSIVAMAPETCDAIRHHVEALQARSQR